MKRKKDHYEILGIAKDATNAQIRKAYKQCALKHHPDRNRSPEAEERFKEINLAYSILSNESSREEYDLKLERNDPDIYETVVTPPPPSDDSNSITPDRGRRISITVDPSLCLAFGSCETLAPTVFFVDRNAWINPKVKILNENGADLDTILDAAQTCPTRAIIIVDRETGEQIYP